MARFDHQIHSDGLRRWREMNALGLQRQSSSSGCLYGVISRISVSLITCTCGARSSGLGYSLGYAGHDQYS